MRTATAQQSQDLPCQFQVSIAVMDSRDEKGNQAMSTGVNDLLSQIAEAHRALQQEPNYQAHIKDLEASVGEAQQAVQNRELAILKYKSEVEDLREKLARVEAERDDYGFRHMEAEDKVNALLKVFHMASDAVKVYEPKPEPVVETVPTETAVEAVETAPETVPTEAAPVETAPETAPQAEPVPTPQELPQAAPTQEQTQTWPPQVIEEVKKEDASRPTITGEPQVGGSPEGGLVKSEEPTKTEEVPAKPWWSEDARGEPTGQVA